MIGPEQLFSNTLNESFWYLTKRQREAVSLKFFQDMDTDEISAKMKINPQSVYNLIFGALRTLKIHISPEKLAFAWLLLPLLPSLISDNQAFFMDEIHFFVYNNENWYFSSRKNKPSTF